MHSETEHRVKAGGYSAYIKRFLSEYLCMSAYENGIIVEYFYYCFVCSLVSSQKLFFFVKRKLNAALDISLLCRDVHRSKLEWVCESLKSKSFGVTSSLAHSNPAQQCTWCQVLYQQPWEGEMKQNMTFNKPTQNLTSLRTIKSELNFPSFSSSSSLLAVSLR